MNRLILFSLLVVSIFAKKNNWAILVAGSDTYWNYRHQADVFHAYQIVKKNGIDESHIIVMAKDDVAHNKNNPFPGKIFNRPDGEDVYEGVQIDYKGNDVTPENFMKVLTGKEEEMKEIGTGKVLKSDENSNVFIFFSDHGAEGLIAFPRGELFDDDLEKTFIEMHNKKMFKKLVFYLETCHSGSMFYKIADELKEFNIFALSAANPFESSYGCYCGDEATVGGINLGTCLGDLFSVSWMEHSDSIDLLTTTVGTQVNVVTKRTTFSEVCQYGDLTPKEQFLIEYQGEKESAVKRMKFLEYVKEHKKMSRNIIKNTEVYLTYLRNKAKRTNNENDIEEYKEELQKRLRSKRIFELFIEKLNVPDKVDERTNFDCYRSLLSTYKKTCGFNIDRDNGYLSTFYRFCATGNDEKKGVETIKEICSEL
jgi:legumain